MATYKNCEAGDLLVTENAGIEERMRVLPPSPFIEPVVEEDQESQPVGNKVVREAAGSEFISVHFEELVPLRSLSSKRHPQTSPARQQSDIGIIPILLTADKVG